MPTHAGTILEPLPAADRPALAAWKRRRWRAAFLLMPLGIALVMLGSFLDNGLSARGLVIGSVGVMAIVVGALCARLALAGPFPKEVLQ